MKKPKRKAPECNRWTPVRRGAIYCSPGCGYDCTHDDYLLADIKAERLARRCGPGFVPHVWENLGWHHAAVSKNNHVKVHPYKGQPGYTIFFGNPQSSGGDFTSQGSNLKEALVVGLNEAKKRRDVLVGVASEIEKALS